MTKYIFFDIDGTLWDGKMQIPDSTKETIKKLHENGHKLFLCSGRSRSNIIAKELWDLEFDGVIAACGNYIEMDGKVLYDRLLSQDVVTKTIKLMKEERIAVVLEGPKYHWVDAEDFDNDPYVDYLIAEMGRRAKKISDFDGEYEIEKFSANVPDSADWDRVVREISDEFDILMHGEHIVEFVPKGTSKATGIAKLCELLDIDLDDTYCAGDSVNDLDMLGYVPHSIAMGNGCEEAKALAEFVTTDIHEDGIKNAMLHYGLI